MYYLDKKYILKYVHFTIFYYGTLLRETQDFFAALMMYIFRQRSPVSKQKNLRRSPSREQAHDIFRWSIKSRNSFAYNVVNHAVLNISFEYRNRVTASRKKYFLTLMLISELGLGSRKAGASKIAKMSGKFPCASVEKWHFNP